MLNHESTICAIATPAGVGAISMIRVSGPDAIAIVKKIISTKKDLAEVRGYTVHFGRVVEGNEIIDEVLISIFKSPQSYTGEDLVEISCHGSLYIQQKLMELLIRNGAVLAQPGEFTLRAFLNGKMDLSQAEAVADLIQSVSKSAHQMAMHQMRGDFSNQINQLRERLLNFASLIELELDFSEEDVEFANRESLRNDIVEIMARIKKLTDSFQYGNVIKNGVPVAIIGKPNVGKSTLLNALLNEERAIVSDIPGTTRDTIEDTITIEGVLFRFIDTAGIRHTTDTIESMGIERTFANVRKSKIILYLIEPTETIDFVRDQLHQLSISDTQQVAILVNKIDKLSGSDEPQELLKNLKNELQIPVISISAKNRLHLDEIHKFLLDAIHREKYSVEDVIVTNVRHYEALINSYQAAERLLDGMNKGLPNDLLAEELRQILYYMGSIVGNITSDEVLGNIFKNFCIGK